MLHADLLSVLPLHAGFERGESRKFILERVRLAIVRKLLAALRSPTERGWGKLLSGPNGAGKSGVGLLAFLVCVAQSRLAVYLPMASAWVAAAQRDPATGGIGADEFFLDQFVQQNADLIVAHPVLLPVFLPYFRGEEQRLGSATMDQLAKALENNRQVRVAVILAEVQAITQVVEEGRASLDVNEQRAANYFRSRWYGWLVKPARLFVRLDIASSHGELRAVARWRVNQVLFCARNMLSRPRCCIGLC